MLPYIAALALAGAWLGYSRAAKGNVDPNQALPPVLPTGVPEIDEIVVTANRTGAAADFDTMARTIWAEARGEGYQGMQAVANVIVNRFRSSQKTPGPDWWGNTIAEICLAPAQFSAWNSGDANRALALSVTPADLQFRTAQEITLKAIGGVLPDLTFGAVNYHAVGTYPAWASAARRTVAIGQHIFYA